MTEMKLFTAVCFSWLKLIPYLFCSNYKSFPPPSSFTVSSLHQILKLFAWEPSFQAQVEDIRGKELKVMKKFAYLTSVSTFIFSCAPAVVSLEKRFKAQVRSQQILLVFAHFCLSCILWQVSLATFAVFVSVSSDNVLTAEKAFTSISLFNILRFPLAMLPMLIASIVQVKKPQYHTHAHISPRWNPIKAVLWHHRQQCLRRGWRSFWEDKIWTVTLCGMTLVSVCWRQCFHISLLRWGAKPSHTVTGTYIAYLSDRSVVFICVPVS